MPIVRRRIDGSQGEFFNVCSQTGWTFITPHSHRWIAWNDLFGWNLLDRHLRFSRVKLTEPLSEAPILFLNLLVATVCLF